jgi:hypothetical protein
MRELIASHRRGVSRTLELLTGGGLDAVVTKCEDRLITNAGCAEAMPADWWPGDDRYARYRAAGLDPTCSSPLRLPNPLVDGALP